MIAELAERLRAAGLRPSEPRLAVARLVFGTTCHPTADRVWDLLRAQGAEVSRATVYKTLSALAEAGLVDSFFVDGRLVFDARTEPHHHVVDVETGAIHDLPPDRVEVLGLDRLDGLDVVGHQVLIRARVRDPRALSM